jgi:hypothetical protein
VEVIHRVYGFFPAALAVLVGVIFGEVKVIVGLGFEFCDFFLFERFTRAIEEWADGFEGFGPCAFFDFFAFEF